MSEAKEKRYAVLIASSRFPEEPKLKSLRLPENDVDGMYQVLSATDHGAFTDIAVLKNRPHHEVLLKINQTLRNAGKNDLVMIYYAGHGKLNLTSQLHLATVNTVLDVLEATSIPVETIRNYVNVSPSNKVVLMLDCCYSAAAGGAFSRGSVDDQLQLLSGGRGIYIMTASTEIQVAVEQETDQYGLFTKHIIEGIRGGEADRDEDGQVDMNELYRYVHDKVLEEGSQEPTKWDLNVRGELIIARTGKTPREDRNREIRARLLELSNQGILPDNVLSKALDVLARKPLELTGALREYDALLRRLHQARLGVGEFVNAWYQVAAEPPLGEQSRAAPRPRQTPSKTKSAGQPKPDAVTDAERYNTKGVLSLGGAIILFLLEGGLPGAILLVLSLVSLALGVLGVRDGSKQKYKGTWMAWAGIILSAFIAFLALQLMSFGFIDIG